MSTETLTEIRSDASIAKGLEPPLTESLRTEPHVILISDLDPLADAQQRLCIRARDTATLHVPPYSFIGAAHAISAVLAEPDIPAGSILVVTVDPHVGQNNDEGRNINSKRIIAIYHDGTIFIGPANAYARAGETHRGPIQHVFEIDRQKLLSLRLTTHNNPDVFDGLSVFGPAARGLLQGKKPQDLGKEISENVIPKLEIKEGTITDIEDPYGNLRLEVDGDEFEKGNFIAMKDEEGKVLFLARKEQSFNGNTGDIVAVNGSKTLITDRSKKALYVVAIQGNLAKLIEEKTGRKLLIGDRLLAEAATDNDIRLWNAQERVRNVSAHVRDLARQFRERIFVLATHVARIAQ